MKGRKKIDPQERKSVAVGTWITPAQDRTLKEALARTGEKLGAFIRNAILDRIQGKS